MIYMLVGLFGDENEAYDPYNYYALVKGFEFKETWSKYRTDEKVIRRQLVYSKYQIRCHKCTFWSIHKCSINTK